MPNAVQESDGPGYPRGTAWMATPLPQLPRLDVEKLLEMLKALRIPEVGSLPTKPQWMSEMESPATPTVGPR